jgi:transcriptional regulator with XRE-family HTH domain
MVGADSPTLRRRELAARLRALRHRSGRNIDDVAAELLCSPAKISRIETGQRGANARDVRDLCRLYGVNTAEQEQLMTLARESRQRAWWQQADVSYGTFIGLEQAAASIIEYSPLPIPGLLQTPAYARALIHGVDFFMSDAEVEAQVSARLTRQNILERDQPPDLSFIIDESALHRRVGGAHVMAEQIDRLLELADRPRITIQVIDYNAGAHPGVASNFQVVSFTDTTASSVVFVEGILGEFYLETDKDLARYRRTFDHLRSVALSPANSLELMAAVRKSHEPAA